MENWLSDLPLYMQVFLGSVVGTALVGFLFRIAEIVVQNRIERENEQHKDKKAFAEQIITVCIEAKTSSYSFPPDDMNKLYTLSEKIKLEDEKMGTLMDHFIALWQICAIHKDKKRLSKEEKEFVTQLQNDADHVSDKLLKMINKWRK